MSKEIKKKDDDSCTNIVSKAAADKFRDRIKLELLEHSEEFWKNLKACKPKDFCDVYLKMMPYGFAKVPDEKPLDEEGKQRLILEETTRKATLISGGLPEIEDYEE
jgi:hypothetical protein